MGFVPLYSGEIKIAEKSLNTNYINFIRSLIAWVPQELNFSVDTVKNLVSLPFTFKLNKPLAPSDNEIREIFKTFGLKDNLLHKQLSEISAGEKQRIVLAVSVLLKKQIYLLDESTSALDNTSKSKVMNYFFNDPEITLISISHDKEWMNRSNKIIDLNTKRVLINRK